MSKEQVSKQVVPGRTPEQQAAVDEFMRQIGPAFVAALNQGVLKNDRSVEGKQ